MKFYLQIDLVDADDEDAPVILDKLISILDAVEAIASERLDITEIELPEGTVVKEIH